MIKIFENDEFGKVRTVIKDGEPWLVGKDVAEILGYSNTRDALSRHVDTEDKTTVVISDSLNLAELLGCEALQTPAFYGHKSADSAFVYYSVSVRNRERKHRLIGIFYPSAVLSGSFLKWVDYCPRSFFKHS